MMTTHLYICAPLAPHCLTRESPFTADEDRRPEVFVIAATDTMMERPNSELMAEAFPAVPPREGVGDHDTLLSINRARRVLGYEPEHSWWTR